MGYDKVPYLRTHKNGKMTIFKLLPQGPIRFSLFFFSKGRSEITFSEGKMERRKGKIPEKQ